MQSVMALVLLSTDQVHLACPLPILLILVGGPKWRYPKSQAIHVGLLLSGFPCSLI